MEQDNETRYRYQTAVNIVAEMIISYLKDADKKASDDESTAEIRADRAEAASDRVAA